MSNEFFRTQNRGVGHPALLAALARRPPRSLSLPRHARSHYHCRMCVFLVARAGDPVWLDAHGGLVEPHTAEEYFSGSQWYDRTCLNEQWKIQGVYPTDDARSRSTGVEYRLVHLQPPILYVLRKERRESGQDPRALGSYYILDGTIFQAPTVEHVITSRMAKCVYHVKAAMGLLQKHAVCDAQYDFESLWDFQRGATPANPTAPPFVCAGPAGICLRALTVCAVCGPQTPWPTRGRNRPRRWQRRSVTLLLRNNGRQTETPPHSSARRCRQCFLCLCLKRRDRWPAPSPALLQVPTPPVRSGRTRLNLLHRSRRESEGCRRR